MNTLPRREFQLLLAIYWLLTGFFLVPIAQAGNRQLSVDSVEAEPGQQVTISIQIDEASGILSADLTVTYPADLLEFVSAQLGTLSQDFSLQVNDNVPGRLVMPLSAEKALPAGKGQLLVLQFQIKLSATAGASGQIQLIESLLWNVDAEQIATTTQSGQIKVLGTPASQPAAADPTPVLPDLPQRKVSLKTVTVVAGQAVTVPIEVDNASGLLVADLKLSCDWPINKPPPPT